MGSGEANISVSVLFRGCLGSPERLQPHPPGGSVSEAITEKKIKSPGFTSWRWRRAATAEGSQAEAGNQPLFSQRKITRTLCRVSAEQPAGLHAFPSPLRLRSRSFINKRQREARRRRQRPSDAEQTTSDPVALPPLSGTSGGQHETLKGKNLTGAFQNRSNTGSQQHGPHGQGGCWLFLNTVLEMEAPRTSLAYPGTCQTWLTVKVDIQPGGPATHLLQTTGSPGPTGLL